MILFNVLNTRVWSDQLGLKETGKDCSINRINRVYRRVVTANKAVWTKKLLVVLNQKQKEAITICCDNQ